MFSVFSNISKSAIIAHVDSLKPSEILTTLAKSPGGMFNTFILAGSQDEPLYMLKPKAIDVLNWINKKIIFELPNLMWQEKTIFVRIRIATSMLNNLEIEGVLSKETCITYHERLVNRIKELQGLIQQEDLPFLGRKPNEIGILTAHYTASVCYISVEVNNHSVVYSIVINKRVDYVQ